MSPACPRRLAPLIALAMFAAGPAAAQIGVPMDVITRVPVDQITTGIFQQIDQALPPLVIKQSAGPVGSIAASPSGRWLVTAPADRVLRLWDLENGLEAARLFGLAAEPRALAVSEGHVAAASGRRVQIWTTAGRAAPAIELPQDVTALAFAGSDRLLVGRADGMIGEYALDGRELRSFPGHRGAVVGLAVTRGATALASGDANGTLYTWDLASGAGASGANVPGLTALAFAPDGSSFATGQRDGSVLLWARGGQQLGRAMRHRGAVTSLDYAPNGRVLAATGGEKVVRLADVARRSEMKGIEAHTADATGAVFEGRYGRLISTGKDGIVRATEVGDDQPKPLLRMVSTSRGWAAIDDNGRFDGSIDALREIAWGTRDKEVAIDRLSDRFNRPGLIPLMLAVQPPKLQAVAVAPTPAPTPPPAPAPAPPPVVAPAPAPTPPPVVTPAPVPSLPAPAPAPTAAEIEALRQQLAAKAAPPPTATAKALTESIAKAPTVALVEPKNGAEIDADNIEVVVQVTDAGGDVDEVRLYHNGKLVQDKGDRAAAVTVRGGGKRVVQNFRIELAPGPNTIRATAFSKARVESEPAQITVNAKLQTAKPNVEVLAVGINEYKNPGLNLNYGVSDAKGITAFFQRQKKLFGDVRTREVLNAQATKDGILQSIAALRATKPDDLVVIYLAGHGMTTEDGTWYFVPHEVVYPERDEQLAAHGISGAMLQQEIAKLGARKVLMLIDACKSGGAVVAFRGFEERKALRQLARAAGVHVVAAAAQDQLAGEIVRLNHGVFTYAVLEALNGAADGSPKDGVVSVRETLSYVETRLPELSQQYRSKAQYPVVDSRGMDFPVATALAN
jgi:WD40 repeat protein